MEKRFLCRENFRVIFRKKAAERAQKKLNNKNPALKQKKKRRERKKNSVWILGGKRGRQRGRKVSWKVFFFLFLPFSLLPLFPTSLFPSLLSAHLFFFSNASNKTRSIYFLPFRNFSHRHKMNFHFCFFPFLRICL